MTEKTILAVARNSDGDMYLQIDADGTEEVIKAFGVAAAGLYAIFCKAITQDMARKLILYTARSAIDTIVPDQHITIPKDVINKAKQRGEDQT